MADNLYEYWIELNKSHIPELSFKNTSLSFGEWQKKAKDKLIDLLGVFPDKTDPEPEEISSVKFEGYVRKKYTVKVDRYMKMPFYLFIPDIAENKKLPAVLCCHGHGPFCKESVAGIDDTEEKKKDIIGSNYDYARQMAREGFVTLAPDLRGFGERKDLFDPVTDIIRDPCNVNYIKGSLFGIYPMTLNISDLMRCIDFLCSLSFVDSDRIGMMGLSLGGTMTTFVTALDNRIKACDIISYVNPIEAYGIRDGNFCGSQVVPGLYRYFDSYDIVGLIAPRPCLMEMGRNDKCFPFEDLIIGYEMSSLAYKACGIDNMPECDIHDGGHAFSGKKAFDFFKKYL